MALVFLVGCTATRAPVPNAPTPTSPESPDAPATPGTSRSKPPGKIYSVAEVENLADANPRALLNTTLTMRAQVVGGISDEGNSDGCSDVLVLADPENVAAYQKLFDPTASNAEFEHARAVPLVLAGPSRSFPAEVIQMNTGIFTGRFVLCDRALRFRIERAAPLNRAVGH